MIIVVDTNVVVSAAFWPKNEVPPWASGGVGMSKTIHSSPVPWPVARSSL